MSLQWSVKPVLHRTVSVPSLVFDVWSCIFIVFILCFTVEFYTTVYVVFVVSYCTFIVSTRSIRWILWFSVRYAAAARREIFSVIALRGKQQQLGSPDLQNIFIGG